MMNGGDTLNQKEELILKILSSVDIIEGKAKFVQILYFTCKLFEKHQKIPPFSYELDKSGVYFLQLEPTLENLENRDLVDVYNSPSTKRQDLLLKDNSCKFCDPDVVELGSEIGILVKALNPYSYDDVVAFSYHLFPDTAVQSTIKPKINEKISELFFELDYDLQKSEPVNAGTQSIASNTKALYPRYNDLDMRQAMAESLGMSMIPPIIPDSIDKSSGIIDRESFVLKNYDLEKLFRNARCR